MIFGITDSERLCLVKVNFDTIDKSNGIKFIHNITSDSFRKQIESEFPELFKGIDVWQNKHKTLRWSNTSCRTYLVCTTCNAGNIEMRT